MSSPDDDIPPQLKELLAAIAATGVPVSVQVVRLPGRSTGEQMQPREKCTLPHSPCPNCTADLCFGQKNEAPLHIVCGKCAALLSTEREPLPRLVRLLSDDEVMAMTDDLRIPLLRAQRHVVEHLQAHAGGKH